MTWPCWSTTARGTRTSPRTTDPQAADLSWPAGAAGLAGHHAGDATGDDNDALDSSITDQPGVVRMAGQDLDGPLLAGVRRDLDPEPDPAVHLDWQHDGRLGRQRLVGLGKRCLADGLLVPEAGPEFLGYMRGQRRDHEHQRLGEWPRHHSPGRGDPAGMTGELLQPGEGDIEHH